MTHQLDSLQLKIQTQLLHATFLKNMALLKANMPAIYEYYQHYQATHVQLAIDDNGAVNLAVNNAFFYPEDPKAMSDQQVDTFLQSPLSLDFEMAPTESESYTYQHEEVINKIFNQRRDEIGKQCAYQLKTGDQINFIAFIGSGLGHHIDTLYTRFAIRSLFIFEPDPDMFFATLHSVDLTPWFETCQRLGGELTLKIGGVEEDFINDIYQYFRREGFFNLVQMYLYRHYRSDKTTDAFNKINTLAYRYKAGWGFCEDEIIGISHTLTNISKNKGHILIDNAQPSEHRPPVFIIGNGPSLSDDIDYLKANQHHAIIISSGTSLKPLLDNGICPDMHVEQERPKAIYQWVKRIGHEATLKTIPLICLNTVYPGILSLFKQPYIAMKSGDAGAGFIHDYISDKYTNLLFCNPTVTNASTAIAVNMGFTELYLFGLDYGFKSKESHHAKGSAYDEVKSFTLENELSVPDNEGGQINTTRIFDFSRGVLEMLLGEYAQVKCVNVSNGAYIQHTQYCPSEKLPAFLPIKDKQKVVEATLAQSFNDDYFISQDLLAEFEAIYPTFKHYIFLLCNCLDDVETKAQLTEAFALQYKFVNDLQTGDDKTLFHQCFNGTLNYLQASIMDNVSRYRDITQQQAYIQFCINEMQQHLLFLLNDLHENFNQDARA